MLPAGRAAVNANYTIRPAQVSETRLAEVRRRAAKWLHERKMGAGSG
jgi:hypothetical protein